jgi:hypothetical protein
VEDRLVFAGIFGFDCDFLLLNFLIDRVAMVYVSGDSADGKHQGRDDQNGIVAVHPGSQIKFVTSLDAIGVERPSRENERTILP